jgi:hypothetical protein
MVLLLALSSPALFAAEKSHGFSGSYREVETLVYGDLSLHRGEIEASCASFGVDPSVLYAVLFIEKVQYELNFLRRTKEALVGSFKDFRLFQDDLYTWAKLSTGYTHIKPAFAAETRRRLSTIPPFERTLSAEEVRPSTYTADVAAAIKIAAAGLFVLERQWQASPYQIDLRRRPDILATLYNLGYEKSSPHPDPLPGGSTMPFIVDGVLIEGVPFGQKVVLILGSQSFRRFLAQR